MAGSDPSAPIAETTGGVCGSNHAQHEASHDSVGESEGASVAPSVGAEVTAVQLMLVEQSKQVLKAPHGTEASCRLTCNTVASTVCAAG